MDAVSHHITCICWNRLGITWFIIKSNSLFAGPPTKWSIDRVVRSHTLTYLQSSSMRIECVAPCRVVSIKWVCATCVRWWWLCVLLTRAFVCCSRVIWDKKLRALLNAERPPIFGREQTYYLVNEIDDGGGGDVVDDQFIRCRRTLECVIVECDAKIVRAQSTQTHTTHLTLQIR